MATTTRNQDSGGRPPERIMAFLKEDGAVWVAVRDDRTATLLGLHANAVRRYLEYGDERPLHEFEGRQIQIGGRLQTFLTDLETIERLADAGELHYELYRR